MVSQFCEDENGALIFNRIINGYNGNNGFGGNRIGGGSYATGGYGYRPVTQQDLLNAQQTGVNVGTGTHSRVETTLDGSKGSSTGDVRCTRIQLYLNIIQYSS